VCGGLEEFGVVIDPARNEACRGVEGEIGAAGARVKVFVIPANEELVLAREVYRKVAALN
jgi:acetate kinase